MQYNRIIAVIIFVVLGIGWSRISSGIARIVKKAFHWLRDYKN